MGWIRVFVAFTLLTAWTVPTRAADREHQQLMADIRILQEQTLHLQFMINTLTETLSVVTTTLETQNDLTRRAFADQRVLVDNLGTDVRIMREKLDDTNLRISALSQELEALRLSIPRPPPPSVEDGLTGAASEPGVTDGGTPVAVSTMPLPPGASPQRMYDTAWADYTAGQWGLAIGGFEAYLKTFPRSDQADNAQHLIGESYFSDGRFQEAVSAYNQVIVTYPDGDAVPLAYYKRGLALDRLGDELLARESYAFVVDNYPTSDAGRLAKQALDRLDRRNDER